MRLADALANTGRLDEASAEARRILEMAGRTASALGKLANLSIMSGDTATAREVLAERNNFV